MALIAQPPMSLAGQPKMATSDLLRSSSMGIFGTPLNIQTQPRLGISTSRGSSASTVTANLFDRFKGPPKFNFPKFGFNLFKKFAPKPALPKPVVEGPEKFPTHFTDFKPLKDKRKPIRLAFEKPLIEIEMMIAELKQLCAEVDYKIPKKTLKVIEGRYKEARRRVFSDLTPIQRVNIARHPHRPTFLDHIYNITDKFTELHGDRAGYNDPAIVCGLGSMDGQTYMFVGQQKGRNTKENVRRNFGMPTPHGYRKALRFFRYADHFNFPIVTFVDTPGAFADLKSEYLGQAEAIAMNLREMFGFKVPIITIILGEGGSGGALAIAVCNKMLMLENSVFFVASPEACASILWKKARLAPKAARKLRITARELVQLEMADAVIPEPIGGAHSDPKKASQLIKQYIKKSMDELTKMSEEELLNQRYQKFRKMGRFSEDKSGELASVSPQRIERLKMNIDDEYSKALSAIGFKATVDLLQQELKKSETPAQREEIEKKIKKVKHEINQHLPSAPNYSTLKSQHDKMKDISRAKSNVKVKQELKKKLQPILDDPETKKKFDKLRSIVEGGMGGDDYTYLTSSVKILYVNEKKKLQYQIAKVLRSFCLLGNSDALEKAGHLALRAHTDEYEAALYEVVDGVMKDTEEVVEKSPKLKRKMELLTKLYSEAKGKPGAESKLRIQVLVKDVRRTIRKALERKSKMRFRSKVEAKVENEPEVKNEAKAKVEDGPEPEVKNAAEVKVEDGPKPEVKNEAETKVENAQEPEVES